MKYFEGKRSLNINVKWFDAINGTQEESLEKQSMLDPLSTRTNDPKRAEKAPAGLQPWIIMNNYDTPEALRN